MIDLLFRDDGADSARGGFDDGRLTGDHDLFRDTGERHREIDRQFLTDVQHDAFTRLSLEAGQRGSDGVGARHQRRHDEVPLGTTDGFPADACCFVGDGHGDARQDGLGWIEHRTVDDGSASLRKHRRGKATDDDCQQSAGPDPLQHLTLPSELAPIGPSRWRRLGASEIRTSDERSNSHVIVRQGSIRGCRSLTRASPVSSSRMRLPVLTVREAVYDGVFSTPKTKPDVDALTQGREPDSGIRERLNRVDEMGLLPNRFSFQHKLHIGLYSNYQQSDTWRRSGL